MGRVFCLLPLCLYLAFPQRSLAHTCGEAFASVHAERPPKDSDLANLYRMIILPVLDEGGRASFARFRFNAREKSITVTSPVGEYVIRLTHEDSEVSPRLGLPEIDIKGGKVEAEITLPAASAYTDLGRSQGLFRSALRADRFLHPHLRPGDGKEYAKATLSFPQREALSALVAMEGTVKGRRGIKRGLVMPPGMGKTVIAAKYVAAIGDYNRKRRARGWRKPPRVLFVVENKWILDRTVETFVGELGIDKVSRIYDEGTKDAINPAASMVAITRSSYFARVKAIHEMLEKDPDQPWVIVFDEAHHLGKADGQFEGILKDLDKTADSRHRILLLSATPWHPDTPLITKYLQGHIYGAFLNKEEQGELQHGQKLLELSRLQFYRGMQAGYLSPLFGLNLIRNIGGKDTRTLLTGSSTATGSRVRTVNHYRSLLQDVARRIKSNHVTGLADRGVIYVDTRARAETYAKALSKLLGAEVRPFHAGQGVDPSTFDWFSDRNQYATEKDRKKPKYIVAVDMLKEGVDIPGINLLVLLRTYGDDMGGFRNLMQNLGRGVRNYSNAPLLKPHIRVFDYSTYARWLRDGLAQISVEPRSRPGSRSRTGQGYVVVDKEILDPIHFLAEYFSLFPKEGSFVQEFPFFDLQVFKSEGLRYLHEQAGNYGIAKFGTNFGTKELILKLADRLPASPEKDELISKLKDNAVWGWKSSDGVEAKQSNSESDPALQRVYRALYRIAALEKLSTAGQAIDLAKIHEASELKKLFDILDPDRVHSLSKTEERKAFLDAREGAWSALAREMQERNLGKVSDVGGAAKLFEALAKSLPESKEREALLIRLKEGDLALGGNDGQRLNSSRYIEEQTHLDRDYVRTHGSLQRAYRALYAIALVLKKSPLGAQINLSRLYTRAETEKLLNALNPDRIGIALDAHKRAVFLDENKGSLRFLASKAQNFGVRSFAHNFGGRDLLLALADRLPDSKEKHELIADLKDQPKWDWGAKDGGMILEEGYENPTSRFFRGLTKIAQALNRLQPEAKIDLGKMHEKGEGERFFDQLILGFGVSAPSDRDLERFSRTALPVLEERASEFGVSAYVTDYGPKRLTIGLAQALAKKAPRSEPLRRLLKALGDDTLWGWRKGDGDMVKQSTSPRALTGYYRAVSAIAILLKQIDPRAKIEPSSLFTPKGMGQFLDRLKEISVVAESRVP